MSDRVDPVSQAIARLNASKNSFRCADLVALLESLHFEVRAGSNGQHKIYVHSGLAPDFKSSSFDCGHGKDPQIRSCYIRNVIRVLEQNKQKLQACLAKQSNDNKA